MSIIQNQNDIRDMARGAVFLGAGGGGDPQIGELFLHNQLAQGRKPNIVSAETLDDDAFVVSIAGVGAPTVLVEYLVSEAHLLDLLEKAEAFYGRKVDALISAEIGGANSMFPLALSASTGLPVIDADGMGRAFPHLEMTTFSVYGSKATPAIVTDELGNKVTLDLLTDRLAEETLRPVVAALGAMVFSAIYPMTAKFVKANAVHGSITHSLAIGRCIREGRDKSEDVFETLLQYLNQPDEDRHAKILFDGKIVDVSHETRDGWHWGKAVLRPLDNGPDEFEIEIQNEFIIARKNGEPAAVVPELIIVLDRETGEPMTAEMLRYGLRVKVVGYSSAEIMRRPECLEVWGPKAFGLDMDFMPISECVA
ncbi:DUF917 domain-containing protein [Alterisphingorhabdus coralli]|uniref:DUF917 domain-containing protein n=1 Tax=Alterisphingorhabdus coralli TaxID=3071408 RepID=A0AA97F6E2_9SPHN|nr:DUF917 domain-containing protein [Parasphingorhabdus sp. SCSIO 66989]WOE75204.1 DUF917 domain-containing protein [Parasphingorhabdus sp. SCSIO 66989]